MNQKPTLVVIVATLLSALLQFLNWTPDPAAASDIIAQADQLKEAIAMRNLVNILTAAIGIVTFVYLWLTGRLKKPTATLLLCVIAAQQWLVADLHS